MLENILIGLLLIIILFVVVAYRTSRGNLYGTGALVGIILFPTVIVLLSIWAGRLFETFIPANIQDSVEGYVFLIFILLGSIMLLNDYRKDIQLKKVIKSYNEEATNIILAFEKLLENKQTYEESVINRIENCEGRLSLLDFKNKNTLFFRGDILSYTEKGKLTFHLQMAKKILEELDLLPDDNKDINLGTTQGSL